MKARFVFEDKSTKIIDVNTHAEGEVTVAALKPEEVGSGVAYVDFLIDYFSANVGDDGWFMTDATNQGVMLTYFTERPDCHKATDHSVVPCFGFNKGGKGILGIVTGMRLDMVTVIGVRDGVYYTYPRILLEGDMPYEDIRMELHFYEKASYAQMARTYRDYQIRNKGCVRLSERIEKDARLKKAAESVEVRIRQGWKPVPTPVEEQTPETEPPMHVACTFDRARDVVREFKNVDINNAELCLVGWNYGGHDGRFPQIFPADPRLGGDDKLSELIAETKELGYVCVSAPVVVFPQ